MKKSQQSTNLGVASILTGFLAVYQDVQLAEFSKVFMSLTYGELLTMIAPFIIGVWAMIHDEDNNESKY